MRSAITRTQRAESPRRRRPGKPAAGSRAGHAGDRVHGPFRRIIAVAAGDDSIGGIHERTPSLGARRGTRLGSATSGGHRRRLFVAFARTGGLALALATALGRRRLRPRLRFENDLLLARRPSAPAPGRPRAPRLPAWRGRARVSSSERIRRRSSRAPNSGRNPAAARCSISGFVDLEIDALPMRGALHALELQIDDVADLLPVERVEDDDLVDAVEELGPEMHRAARPSARAAACPARPRRRRERASCRWMMSEPRLLVAMMMVLVKSTTRPLPSVRRPSSNTCRRTL